MSFSILSFSKGKKLKKEKHSTHPRQAPAAEAVPAGRGNGLVQQPRAHRAVGVVEAQARGHEARGRGGDGNRCSRNSGSGRRCCPFLCQQRLLRPLQARDGICNARVQLQRVEERRARVPKPLQQVQRVAGARRRRGPPGRQGARSPGVAQGELRQMRGVEAEERARLGLRGRDRARGGSEAGEGRGAAGAEDGLGGGVGCGGGGRGRSRRRRRRRCRRRARRLRRRRGVADGCCARRAGQPQREAELVRGAVEVSRGDQGMGAGGEGRGRVGVFLFCSRGDSFGGEYWCEREKKTEAFSTSVDTRQVVVFVLVFDRMYLSINEERRESRGPPFSLPPRRAPPLATASSAHHSDKTLN